MTKYSFEERTDNYIKENAMLKQGDSIAAGISGGADSVCLFFVLLRLKEKYGLKLKVIHVMHGIRGDEAERDKDFVKALCKRHNVPFFCKKADVPALAKDRGMSVEEAGRYVRYEAFEEAGCDVTAVAHNANDLAETVLFNLIRGSMVTGLCGIQPVNGRIIRPLLCVTREEIEEYLTLCDEKWINDSTNYDNEYSRNKIRNIILKTAKEINAGAIDHITRTAGELRKIDAYLEKNTGDAKRKYVIFRDDLSAQIRTEATELEEIIFERMIYDVIAGLGGRKKDITAAHVNMVRELFYGISGKKADLIYGLQAERSFDCIIIRRTDKEQKEASADDEIMLKEGILKLPGGCEAYVRVFDNEGEDIENLSYTKWFDYDKIKYGAVFRTRRAGDRITIKNGSKKVKDVLIEGKVPAHIRDSIYMLADGDEIMWVPGIRYSESYRIDRETKKILEVIFKEAEDGR
ncbi:MAG: tRNA lysidine(34) synthetase TilS [Lachnospiraceae bacterium]|nr:tRNA lysidine(34) synthetase TilS [Lachnospiraceae bacterium]